MADLQELSKLLTDIEIEASTLLKRSETLRADIQTKEARLAYIEAAIATSEQAYETSKTNQQATVDAVTQDITNLKTERDMLQSGVDRLHSELAIVQSDVLTVKQQYEQLTIDHSKAVTDRTNELKTLGTEVSKLRDIAKLLLSEIDSRKTVRSTLDDELASKKQETELQISEYERLELVAKQRLLDVEKQLSNRDDELATITEKIEAATTQLADTRNKHDAFLVKEKEAKAQLLAREQALLDKESELSVRQRRPGILDNF